MHTAYKIQMASYWWMRCCLLELKKVLEQPDWCGWFKLPGKCQGESWHL